MSGGRRPGTLLVCAGLAALAIAGCGGSDADEPDGVRTNQPEVTFAPVIQLARGESHRPMDSSWFINRSELWLAQGFDCDSWRIAVGRQLKDRRTDVTDWIYPRGLGWGLAYWRQMLKASCDSGDKRQGRRYYTYQLTRPHDPSSDRAEGLYDKEGYYLDLIDQARGGPPRADNTVVPVWYKRRSAGPGIRPGLRITYWMLYGMDRPRDAAGRPLGALTHEGDWERVDVLLAGEKGRYRPVAVRLIDAQGKPRRIPWSALRHADGGDSGEATHPVLYAARDTHTLYDRPGSHRQAVPVGDRSVTVVDRATGPCPGCERWQTWDDLRYVRTQDWYGFGGAWGEPGATSATTGPLGPHGEWHAGHAAAALKHRDQRPHECEERIWRRNCTEPW